MQEKAACGWTIDITGISDLMSNGMARVGPRITSQTAWLTPSQHHWLTTQWPRHNPSWTRGSMTDSSAAHYLPPRGSMTLWRRANVQRQKEGHHKSLTCRGRCFFWGARAEEAASKHTQERRLLLATVQPLPPHPATPRAFQQDSHLRRHSVEQGSGDA